MSEFKVPIHVFICTFLLSLILVQPSHSLSLFPDVGIELSLYYQGDDEVESFKFKKKLLCKKRLLFSTNSGFFIRYDWAESVVSFNYDNNKSIYLSFYSAHRYCLNVDKVVGTYKWGDKNFPKVGFLHQSNKFEIYEYISDKNIVRGGSIEINNLEVDLKVSGYDFFSNKITEDQDYIKKWFTNIESYQRYISGVEFKNYIYFGYRVWVLSQSEWSMMIGNNSGINDPEIAPKKIIKTNKEYFNYLDFGSNPALILSKLELDSRIFYPLSYEDDEGVWQFSEDTHNFDILYKYTKLNCFYSTKLESRIRYIYKDLQKTSLDKSNCDKFILNGNYVDVDYRSLSISGYLFLHDKRNKKYYVIRLSPFRVI